MKKFVLFVGIVSMLVSACSDNFLEISPKDELSEGNFYKSQEEFILLVNGSYLPLRNFENDMHWIVSEMRSDNTSHQNNPENPGRFRKTGVVDLFTSSVNTETYEWVWDNHYRGIHNSNKVINQDMSVVNWTPESLRDRSKGEGYFLRALYYFNLVRLYGGVPLVLKPIPAQEAVNVKRSTTEEVYASIVNDLKAAQNHFSKAMDVEKNGRADWGAATALLAKVYLTIQEYGNAEKELKKVIDSGRYRLLEDYDDLFIPQDPDYTETIFSVQYSAASLELAQSLIGDFAPWTSGGEVTNVPGATTTRVAGQNQPTQTLINAFESGDERKDVAINYWHGEDWDGKVRDIPYSGKYKPPQTEVTSIRSGQNIPIIRYAEVLLMYAEVLNEQGQTGEAIPYVEQVRSRAGLTDPLNGYNQNSLDTLIAHEYQVELCFENHRWYYLKRTSKALEVMKAHGQREKARKQWIGNGAYQIEEYKLLYPIPVEEIDINQLEQNPRW